MSIVRKIGAVILILTLGLNTMAGKVCKERNYIKVLNSVERHGGNAVWKMKKAQEIAVKTEDISTLKISSDELVTGDCPGDRIEFFGI